MAEQSLSIFVNIFSKCLVSIRFRKYMYYLLYGNNDTVVQQSKVLPPIYSALTISRCNDFHTRILHKCYMDKRELILFDRIIGLIVKHPVSQYFVIITNIRLMH